MTPREASARKRLDYWYRRMRGSMAGTDSTDPDFLRLATRMYNYWVGEVTTMEMQRKEAA